MARSASCRTVAHKLACLERAKGKVERRGPAPIVAELEQTSNMVAQYFNYAKLTPKFYLEFEHSCPMFCMEINDPARAKLKRNLKTERREGGPVA